MARRTDVFLFESDYIAGCFRAGVGETDRVVRIDGRHQAIAGCTDSFEVARSHESGHAGYSKVSNQDHLPREGPSPAADVRLYIGPGWAEVPLVGKSRCGFFGDELT